MMCFLVAPKFLQLSCQFGDTFFVLLFQWNVVSLQGLMLMCKSVLFTDLRFSFNGFKYAKPVEIKMGITQDFLNAVDESLGEWRNLSVSASIPLSRCFLEVGFYLFQLIAEPSALHFVVRKCLFYQDCCKRFSILVGSWDERFTYLVYEKMRERKVDGEMPYMGCSIVWEQKMQLLNIPFRVFCCVRMETISNCYQFVLPMFRGQRILRRGGWEALLNNM